MIVLDGRVVFLVDSCDVPRWQAALFDSVSASTEIGVFAIGPVRAARTPPIAARVYAWLDAWSSRRLGADAGAGSVHVAATWAAIEDAVDAASWIVDLTSTRRASALPNPLMTTLQR